MASIVTNDIADTLLEQITSVLSTRRNNDSSVSELRRVDLTPQNITYLKSVFSYNYGTMSDGSKLRLPARNIYFKFQVNFSLLEENETPYIKNAYERADIEKPSVSVYCNGYKIPDKLVYFYSTGTATDIMIPESLVDTTKTNTIFIEKRDYNIGEYINYYNSAFSGSIITIPINLEKYTNCTINPSTVMVFIDKKLYTKSKEVSANSISISIALTSALANQELEVFIDNGVKYYNSIYTENVKRVIYAVPESYLDSVHGPLSKGSCLFFIDGLRIPNSDISQAGRLHFTYDMSVVNSPTSSVYVTDKDMSDELDTVVYGSDYYLYNFIGCAPITEFFKGFITNTMFDGNIDFYKVLNDNGNLYSRDYINSITAAYNGLTSPQTKASYLLNNRPYLMRTFLEQYGKKVYTYIIYYDGIKQTVIIGLPLETKPADDTKYIIDINNEHVPASEFTIVDKGVTDIFEIPASYFIKGNNTIQITVLSGEYPLTYETVPINSIINNNGTLTFTTNKFKKVAYSVSDIIILEKVVNDDEYSYATTSKVGYKIKSDVNVYINTDNSTTILFDTVPDNTILIYYKNFTYTYSYIKEITSTYKDVFVPIYAGSDSNPIPIICKGNMTVYAGKDKLMPGIDYFVKNPTNEGTVSYSLLVIKRRLDPYTEVNVYFNNITNKPLITKNGYFDNNDYGLFYFSKLPFPVSLSYLNIYLNGKPLNSTDIDILSDKLIRVHSLDTPMFDLSVESAFSVDYNLIEPYFDLYTPDDFEKFIANQFRGIDYTRDEVIGDNPPDTNTLYEKFVTTVDSKNRVKNNIARESEWYKNDEATTDCVTNTGTALGNENINTMNILSNMLFVAGNKGRVACCDVLTNGWHNYNEVTTSFVVNDGTAMLNENIRTTQIINNRFVVMGDNAHVAYCNLLTGRWVPCNAIGDNLVNKDTTIFLGNIYSSIIYNDHLLIIAGDAGRVASFDFTTNKWCAYNESVEGMISNIGIATNGYSIRSMKIVSINDYDVLVVAGNNGVFASCYLTTNSWTKYNGDSQQVSPKGPDVASDGTNRSNKTIYKMIKYGSNLVFLGESGFVSMYDYENKKYYGSSEIDTYNISNVGNYVGNNNIRDAVMYESKYIVTGCENGVVSSFNASAVSWNKFDAISGIINTGVAMSCNDIYAVEVYDTLLSYVIFAGKGGKVASYNIDVHEIPYRFDPFKTAFLLWYTTPGNAKIKFPYNLTKTDITRFRVYRDTSISNNFDIIAHPSDNDLMQTITMNEGTRYPKELYRRTKHIVDFIQSFTGERHTLAEYYNLYKSSPLANILYIEDFIPLRSGDNIGGTTDIKLLT